MTRNTETVLWAQGGTAPYKDSLFVFPVNSKWSYIMLLIYFPFVHLLSQPHIGVITGGNLGFNSLPKHSSSCGLEKPGIKPLTLLLWDDLLYLLSHS